MTVPTDTPSTDGAPDPEEGEWHHNVTHRCPQMGAHTFDRLPIPCEQCTSVEQLTRSIPWQESYFFSRPLRSAAAAGLRVVPEDRPAQCPNCGSTDPRKVGIRPASPLTGDGAYSVAFSEVCSDPWHDEPAGVPALDDDTRREVPEVLLTFAKWADWYLEDGCRRDHHGYCQAHGLDKDCPVGPMREWLAAYLGRTDG